MCQNSMITRFPDRVGLGRGPGGSFPNLKSQVNEACLVLDSRGREKVAALSQPRSCLRSNRFVWAIDSVRACGSASQQRPTRDANAQRDEDGEDEYCVGRTCTFVQRDS